MTRLLLAVSFFFSTSATAAEINRQHLSGMWAYVATYNEFPDGRRESWFGPNPIGRFVIRRDGTYSHIIACSPADKKANACKLDMLVHWGTYTVNRKGMSFTGKVEWASNPILIGKQQLRVVTKLTRNELHYVNHESVAGEEANVVASLRRVRP